MLKALPALSEVDPAEAWKPWQPTEQQPWDLRWSAHLYRRAGFGASLADLQKAIDRGFPATIKLLLNGEAGPDGFDKVLDVYGNFALKRDKVEDLRGWWAYCMVHSPFPLREKMTLFWHNHFATSVIKVQSNRLMYQQNQLLRKHAVSKFGPMLLDVSRDSAMLLYLDSNSNVKGKANENYAREVMELFSLGVGNYTEKDIREAARAFTGWHTDGEAFAFNAGLHDDGPKTVLGQSGNWDGGDVVRIILEQPATARFLVRKLYRYFIGENATPPDALLEPLAESFRKSDYDIAALLSTMLSSQHFFSAHAYRQKIKSPVEFCLGAALVAGRDTRGEDRVKPRALVSRMDAMGQPLFAPPNVKGWEAGKSWLNTSTVLARHNFAEALANGGGSINVVDDGNNTGITLPVDLSEFSRKAKLKEPADIVGLYLDHLVQGDVSEAARKRLIAYLADGKPENNALDVRVREVIHAIMTLPEYQLN